MRKRGILLFSFLFIWSASVFAQSLIKIYRFDPIYGDYALSQYYELEVNQKGQIVEMTRKAYIEDRLAAKRNEEDQIEQMSNRGTITVTYQEDLITIKRSLLNAAEECETVNEELKKIGENIYEDQLDNKYTLFVDFVNGILSVNSSVSKNTSYVSRFHMTDSFSHGASVVYFLDLDNGILTVSDSGTNSENTPVREYHRLEPGIWEAIVRSENPGPDPDNRTRYRIELGYEVTGFSLDLWPNSFIPDDGSGIIYDLWPIWWLLKPDVQGIGRG